MGWLRTNWLDALIFLLVAVIMAGVVLFLTGVNPFDTSRGNPPPTPQTQSPAPPQAEPEAIPPAPPEPEPAPPTPEAEPVVTVLPVPQPPPSRPVPAPRMAEKPPAPARPTPAPTARPGRPVLSADAGGEWRVMVGSFSQPENATRLAARLRQQGYPVGLEPAGGYTRVWVGPYQSQARAQAIAATLAAYQPQVARRPETPRGRFLQVGAFRNPQSAQPVINTVRQAGYPVVLLEEAGWLKVRVGPLEDTAPAARALQARGLEVLEVR